MEKQVAEHGHGPLFRHLPKGKNGKRSTYVARKIDEWMDGVIKDANLAPNHSFRHYLKSELLARDVPERISDAITGHKTPGIGRKYEHVPMSKKVRRDQQIAGDTPPGGVGAKDPARGELLGLSARWPERTIFGRSPLVISAIKPSEPLAA